MSRLPADGAATVIFPDTAIMNVERTLNIWCKRTDFTARDVIRSTNTGLLPIQDSRFLVRGSTGPSMRMIPSPMIVASRAPWGESLKLAREGATSNCWPLA